MNQDNRDPRRKTVTVTHTVTTTREWGDNVRPEASEPSTESQVRLTLVTGLSRGCLDARQVLGRCIRANPDKGYLDTPDRESDDEERPQWKAEAVFYADDLDYAQALAEKIRAGAYDPPAITVEQSKRFSELGIALRADGIFGYQRRCSKPDCKEFVDHDCFGDLDPAKAIQGAEQRSPFYHSLECSMDDGTGLEEVGDHIMEFVRDPANTSERDTLLAADVLEVNEDGDLALADDWWPKAKANDAAHLIVNDCADDVAEYWDHDGSDDAIDCEA